MGKLLWLFGESKTIRKMLVEINKEGSDLLDSVMKKTGLNGSTIYHRALVLYSFLLSAQERGEKILVGDKEITLFENRAEGG